MKLSTHPLADNLSNSPSAPLDQQLILRLRVSFARLLRNGDELTRNFYAMLFERYPSVRPLFPSDMTQQREKLAKTLAWVVTHLDRPDQLLPGVSELGRRHVGYGAVAEHYPLVRDTLVEAMAHTAGSDWNDDLSQDWRQSIDLIGRHMLAAASSPAPTSTAPH